MKRLLLVMLLCTGLMENTRAQVSFYFAPEIYGTQLEGLRVFKVQNLTGTTVQGQVLITVRENSQGLDLVAITTPVTTFPAGLSDFPPALFASALFRFAGNNLAALVNQTRSFPAGD